jgi:hypothetical protein
VYAVRKDESALDIVQDAMIKLAENTATSRQPSCRCCSSAYSRPPSSTISAAKKFAIPGSACFPAWVRAATNMKILIYLNLCGRTGQRCGESSADQVEREQTLAIIDAEVQNCPRVNAKPSSCVIGRIWTWPKRPRDGLFGRQREDTLLPSNACARRNAESQGNNIMNTEELNFAYKVRHALNETLDDLPPATTDRLAQARQMALARKKADGAARRTALSCAANWPVFRAATGHSRGSTAWASPCPCWCWWLA